MKCNFKYKVKNDERIFCQFKSVADDVDICDGEDCMFMKILKHTIENKITR